MTTPSRGSASPWTPQQLRAQRFTRVTRDVYVLQSRYVDLRTRAEALRLVFPEAVVCLSSAAVLLRLPVDDDGLVHLARGLRASRSEPSDAKVHRLALLGDEVRELSGLQVTDGPRTFTHLAARFDVEQLAAVGDIVLRR